VRKQPQLPVADKVIIDHHTGDLRGGNEVFHAGGSLV